MNIWLLLALALIVIACVVFGPVLAALWRTVRYVSHAHSPEFRLQMANMWTEIQQVRNGGSTQMMRMEDGNFILLSVGFDTTKVFVAPRLDSPESFNELASFPITASAQDRRANAEAILTQLRTAIGWPKSVTELRQSIQKTAVTPSQDGLSVSGELTRNCLLRSADSLALCGGENSH